ncbi:MAG: hypothetical protein R3A47_04925 [Polyangiales bacterium]
MIFGLVVFANIAPPRAKAYADGPYGLDDARPSGHGARFHLWGDFSLFSGSIADGIKVTGVSPIFGARFQFTEHWLLDARWGFAYSTVNRNNAPKDRALRVGNPFASIQYQSFRGILLGASASE